MAVSGDCCRNIVTKYKDVLGDSIGCIPGEYDIKIDDHVSPVIHPPRSIPSALREKVKQELKHPEVAGILKRVTEPTPWVSSMVAVSKKDKNRIGSALTPPT